MKTILWYLGGILVGYLLGNINTAAIIARCKGFDIRTKGSGNAGASNALVTMGKGAAVATALVDILKAFVPVFLLMHVMHLPPECRSLPVVTGAAVILGHMFPFWMQFRGGKGYASLLGLILALSWQFFLICIGILAVILLVTRYIALATMICAAALPVFWWIHTGNVPETVLLAVISLVIIIKHSQNIKRILNGTEIPAWGKKRKSQSDSEGQKETQD